jgi:hypothetical protein
MNARRSRTMKTYRAFFIIISIIVTSIVTFQAYSFEGYDKYPMKGNVIFPLTDVDVKLAEISVLMQSTEDVGIPTKAEYILENLSSKEIKFKMGFAIDSSVIVFGESAKMPDDFKVSVNNETVKTSTSKIGTQYFYTDRQGKKIAREQEIPLIMWELSFKPREKKIITTTYTMEWLLDPGAKSLEYDLSRLNLWKGNIDKAYFRLTLPGDLIDDIKAKDPSRWPKVTINPPKYIIKDHALEWSFKDLKKEKINDISIDVNYRKPGVVGD